jgi:hypothetical protein
MSIKGRRLVQQLNEEPRGLYDKYNVTRNDGSPVDGFAFVLRLNDPHARVALLAYAESVRSENPTLWADLVYEVEMYSYEDGAAAAAVRAGNGRGR